jgi:hypothetical protein
MTQRVDPNYAPGLYPRFQPDVSKFKSYTWQEAWVEAMLRPSVETFWRLVNDPHATLERAALWLVGGFVVSSLLSALAQLIFGSIFENLFSSSLFSQTQSSSNIFNQSDTALFSICFAPFAAVIGLIFIFIMLGIIHITAQVFGGKGRFEQMVYGFATFYTPFLIASGLLSFIPLLGSCLTFFLLLYVMVLTVMAVRAVYLFGWVESVVSAFSPLIIAITLCCCCIGAFAGLGATSGS